MALTALYYYPTDWPWIIGHNLAGGAADDLALSFSYNRAGQISQASRDNATDAYTYAGHANIHLEGAADGLNRIASSGFGYDANGNLTSDPGGWGPGHIARTFTYDVENRLVGASGGVTLRYDPLGRLWQLTAPSGTTSFLYDGDALTAEYDANGNVLRRYVHGSNAGADDPLLWYEGATLDPVRHLMADERGSIVAVADANGNAIARNSYDEYGIPAATNLGRFQYTGQLWLPELGLYHYKARMYAPALGRFLQTDPVGYDDQFNLYAYVGNDPVNRIDFSGRWSAEVHGIIFEAAWRGRALNYWPLWASRHQSWSQDLGEAANNYHAHFLRSPGESRQLALAGFNRYVEGQVQAARAAVRRGDEAAAVQAFARAAHAKMDSHSPVHNDHGSPAIYRDRPFVPSLIDAILQNHSPTDGSGGEGTDDMTPAVRRQMVRETRELINRIWGPPRTVCTGSRIRRESC